MDCTFSIIFTDRSIWNWYQLCPYLFTVLWWLHSKLWLCVPERPR